jgi:sulfite exporter TauE/SafE
MQSTLALTALVMGLLGGPHCVAMCGAACAGIGRAAGQTGSSALLAFQLGRVTGYSAMGALAAASLQGVGWLTVQSAALRPVWSLFHVAAVLLGLALVWQARQPAWLDGGARKVWNSTRKLAGNWQAGAPLVIGALWALLPCGLLYSALLVAALAGSVASGALVMACFALGSGLTMTIGPWLWLRLYSGGGSSATGATGAMGIRLAGAALAATSGWALWMGLMHNAAPWCINP